MGHDDAPSDVDYVLKTSVFLPWNNSLTFCLKVEMTHCPQTSLQTLQSFSASFLLFFSAFTWSYQLSKPYDPSCCLPKETHSDVYVSREENSDSLVSLLSNEKVCSSLRFSADLCDCLIFMLDFILIGLYHLMPMKSFTLKVKSFAHCP